MSVADIGLLATALWFWNRYPFEPPDITSARICEAKPRVSADEARAALAKVRSLLEAATTQGLVRADSPSLVSRDLCERLGSDEIDGSAVRRVDIPARVVTTVMFTDIVDSTALMANLGDVQWAAMYRRHNATVRGELARFDGRLVKTLGDGVLATFESPARATLCGLAIVAAMAVAEPRLELRVGIHTGECESSSDDVAGMAVNIAARVTALARANEVLATETVKQLVVGSGITFADRGSYELKGVPDRWRLYEVTRGPAAAGWSALFYE